MANNAKVFFQFLSHFVCLFLIFIFLCCFYKRLEHTFANHFKFNSIFLHLNNFSLLKVKLKDNKVFFSSKDFGVKVYVFVNLDLVFLSVRENILFFNILKLSKVFFYIKLNINKY